jgi:hypothetical protein
MSTPRISKRKSVFHHFPFSFTDELVFYTPDNFNDSVFLKQLAKHLQIENYGYQMKVHSNVSLSKLPVKIGILFLPDTVASKIIFTLSLFENNLVLLAGMLFSSFLFYYNSTTLAVLLLLSAILFYLINLHKSIQNLRKIAIDAAGTNLDMGEPALWKHQQKWLKDPSVCPACGEPTNPYSAKCVNCGLHLTKPKKHSPGGNTNSSGGSINIVYQNPDKHAKDSR